MKLLLTLLPALLTQTTGRRNQRIVIGFLQFTTVQHRVSSDHGL